jgi:thioredoxin reductase
VAGDRVCVIEVPELRDDVDALARALAAAGAGVSRVPLTRVTATRGRAWVSAVEAGREWFECDVVAVAALPAPASEGARQQGCRVELDPGAGGFKVLVDNDGRTSVPTVWACGDVTGYQGPAAAAADGARVGANVAQAIR